MNLIEKFIISISAGITKSHREHRESQKRKKKDGWDFLKDKSKILSPSILLYSLSHSKKIVARRLKYNLLGSCQHLIGRRKTFSSKNHTYQPLLLTARMLLACIFLTFIFACGKKTATAPEIPLTLIDSWGGANVETQARIGYPGDFIVSSKGEVVVTDVRLQQVLFFDRQGHILRRVGRPGKGPLEFAIPDDVAQFGDKLVVWDYQNNRLQFLTLEGEFISTSTPEPRIDFNAKTFDSRGRLYYATGGFRADSMVYVYNRSGEFVKTFGELESGKFTDYAIANLRHTIERRELHAALKNAAILCATSDGGILVVHTALPILKKYTLSGQKLFEKKIDEAVFKKQRDDFFAANDTLPDYSFKPLRYWLDIVADAAGGVFILQNNTAKMIVFHFDANGILIEKYLGSNENISKIYFDGSDLWAVGRENLVFYRFSLTPPDEATTDQ